MGHTWEQKSCMWWILEYLQMHSCILREGAKSRHDIHVCFISTLHTYPELIVCDILVFDYHPSQVRMEFSSCYIMLVLRTLQIWKCSRFGQHFSKLLNLKSYFPLNKKTFKLTVYLLKCEKKIKHPITWYIQYTIVKNTILA